MKDTVTPPPPPPEKKVNEYQKDGSSSGSLTIYLT